MNERIKKILEKRKDSRNTPTLAMQPRQPPLQTERPSIVPTINTSQFQQPKASVTSGTKSQRVLRKNG